MNSASAPCTEHALALHALADNELDAAHALALETHLDACPACLAAFEDILNHKRMFKSENLREEAPYELRESIAEALKPERKVQGTAKIISWTYKTWHERGAQIGAALSALAACLVLFVFLSRAPGNTLDEELIASHVRSTLAAHLTDVASSDQHTVKPWFAGKLDFAPPVPDLAAKGFPLVGGRLDYVGGRVVAALVYRRNQHIINLFVWPQGSRIPANERRDGYNIIAWTAQGFQFALVSDLNSEELRMLHSAFEPGQ